jgi:nitrate reductase NapE component
MYIRELDYGTPVARKTASIIVAAVLLSFIILPILSVGLQIVA